MTTETLAAGARPRGDCFPSKAEKFAGLALRALRDRSQSGARLAHEESRGDLAQQEGSSCTITVCCWPPCGTAFPRLTLLFCCRPGIWAGAQTSRTPLCAPQRYLKVLQALPDPPALRMCGLRASAGFAPPTVFPGAHDTLLPPLPWRAPITPALEGGLEGGKVGRPTHLRLDGSLLSRDACSRCMPRLRKRELRCARLSQPA